MQPTILEQSSVQRPRPPFAVITASVVSITAFLYLTKLAFNPILLFLIALFLLFPYRKRSYFIRRLLLLQVLLFSLWLIIDLNVALLPFALSFLIAYLFDPVIKRLEKWHIPRWLGSLLMLLLLIGSVTAIAIFVFPLVFSQLDQVIRQVSQFVNSATNYLESRQFYRLLASFGIPRETVRDIVQTQLMPRVETLFKTVLEALLSLLTSVSAVANQIVNLVLVPILSFYFLKDLPRLKSMIRRILEVKNRKIYNDLVRISDILKLYIGWQLIAATWIGTAAAVFFSIFGVPYAVVLGVLCGLLNPIPFFGSIACMLIGSVVALLVDPLNATVHILTIVLVINGLHFANAYFIEPRILGSKVGLHPVLLLGSLFIFGHFFGFLGLLVAVPTSAVLMMFFRDWQKHLASLKVFAPDSPTGSDQAMDKTASI